MNNKGDNTHPYLNSHFSSNQYVPSLVVNATWLHVQRDWTALKTSPKISRSSRHLQSYALNTRDRLRSLDKVVSSTQCASLVVVL